MVNNFKPCKVADVGGGKGMLAYLLQESGWDVVIIDPEYQLLPEKYKKLNTGHLTLILSQKERKPLLLSGEGRNEVKKNPDSKINKQILIKGEWN